MKESKSKAEEGWETTIKRCEKTYGLALALHKLGDGFDTENDLKEFEERLLCFISDGENFKCKDCNDGWEEMQDFINENPDYETAYYCKVYYDEEFFSEKAEQAYSNDFSWPDKDNKDKEMAIEMAVNGEYYGNLPAIPVELIYDGEVIYDFVF